MKKSSFLSIIMAFVAMSCISAQDLDQILENHFKAIGQKKLLKVETLQATGKVMIMGTENPFRMNCKRPGKIHVYMEFQGVEIIQAYDGATAWSVNPMNGSEGPVEISGPEAEGIIESGDLDGLLWKYEEKGHKLELVGTEELDSREVFVLKLTKKNGSIASYYLDKESYLIRKVRSKTVMNGAEVDVEALLSNYKEVQGFLLPFDTEQKVAGQTVITFMMEDVKTDVEIDDSIFSMPAGD